MPLKGVHRAEDKAGRPAGRVKPVSQDLMALEAVKNFALESELSRQTYVLEQPLTSVWRVRGPWPRATLCKASRWSFGSLFALIVHSQDTSKKNAFLSHADLGSIPTPPVAACVVLNK